MRQERLRFLSAAIVLTALAWASSPARAALVTFASRAAFDAAYPGAVLEDFEEADIPANNSKRMANPLNSSTNNDIFQPGDIVSGLQLRVGEIGQVPENMLVASSGFASYQSDVVSFNESITPSPRISVQFLNNNVRSFALDVISSFSLVPVTLEIFSGSTSLGSFNMNAASGAGTFFGLESTSDLISSVTLTNMTDGEFFAVDNIAFKEAQVVIPEPSTLAMTAIPALLGLAVARRRLSRRGATSA